MRRSRPISRRLKAALGQLQQATMWLMQNAMKNPDNAGAGSNDYMHLFGLTALGFMWARIAKAVLARQAAGTSNEALDAKLRARQVLQRSVCCRKRARISRGCRAARRR